MIDALRYRIEALAAHPPRRLFVLLWAIWLPFLVPSIVGLFDGHYARWQIAAALVGVAVFVAAYLWAAERNSVTRAAPVDVSLDPPLAEAWPLGVMAALTIVTVLTFGGDWFAMGIYTGASIGPYFRTRRAACLVVLWALLIALIALARGMALPLVGESALLIGGIGTSVVLLAHTARTVRQLREAQAEVARLAVAGERLRFARDLHDLLGHSLSLIALKCDLAQQLLPGAPERARREVADAEQVARAALHEVREAVAGYRQTGLAGEVAGAREVLAAAGVELEYEAAPLALPPDVEGMLAWAVREAVTNVIRHSRARHCWIALAREGGEILLSVVDDGRGAATTPSGHGGSGLVGLAERATALGGTSEAGTQTGGGFRLEVRLPLPAYPEAKPAIAPARAAG